MNPDPRPAPHDSGDDPRVDAAIDFLRAAWKRGYLNRSPVDDQDAHDLLARLDAAAPARDDEPRFDWQAAEEGFVPCARGHRCELQLVRPGKVQCDCDTPGTEAAIARSEAEGAPTGDDTAGLRRWLDGEIATCRGREQSYATSGHDLLFREEVARERALREVRDRLGATTNTPEEGTDGR